MNDIILVKIRYFFKDLFGVSFEYSFIQGFKFGEDVGNRVFGYKLYKDVDYVFFFFQIGVKIFVIIIN